MPTNGEKAYELYQAAVGQPEGSGEWQTIDETITADGPSTAVEVKEAVPVLTGD